MSATPSSHFPGTTRTGSTLALGAVVWLIVGVCCVLPLGWLVLHIISNPIVLRECRLDAFRLRQVLASAADLQAPVRAKALYAAGSLAYFAGETERAALSLAGRLGLSEASIRRDLGKGEGPGFEKTALHERVFAYAEQLDRRTLPRAALPRIELHSPKITRKLTTEWFARRVDERHRRCLERLGVPREG